VGRRLGHPPARTRGTKPPPLTTEGQEDLFLAGITSQAQKAMSKDATLQWAFDDTDDLVRKHGATLQHRFSHRPCQRHALLEQPIVC
jgi:hypothetical protein